MPPLGISVASSSGAPAEAGTLASALAGNILLRMDKVVCPDCGVEYDLSEMEPSYRWPDAYLAVPANERDIRTIGGTDDCRVRDTEDTHRQYFLRVFLPIPIRGEVESCCWGVWVEIAEDAFARARELWDDPDQVREPAFAGVLANELRGYQQTLGLAGMVQLSGPTSAPSFTLMPSLQHPLAREQREGVYPERVIEWLASHCRH